MTRRVEFGVVFDCDGVLVTTEELGWQVWRSLAGDYGIELTLEDLRAITGCTDEESISYFRKWLDERWRCWNWVLEIRGGVRGGQAGRALQLSRCRGDAGGTAGSGDPRRGGVQLDMTGDVEAALGPDGPRWAG